MIIFLDLDSICTLENQYKVRSRHPIPNAYIFDTIIIWQQDTILVWIYWRGEWKIYITWGITRRKIEEKGKKVIHIIWSNRGNSTSSPSEYICHFYQSLQIIGLLHVIKSERRFRYWCLYHVCYQVNGWSQDSLVQSTFWYLE